MNIKTKLIISAVTSSLLSAVLLTYFLYSSNAIRSNLKQHEMTENVKTAIYELDILLHYILLQRNDNTIDQWHKRYRAGFSLLVDAENILRSPNDTKILQGISNDYLSLGRYFIAEHELFDNEQKMLQDGAPLTEISTIKSLQEKQVSTLLATSQRILSDANHLSQNSYARVTDIYNTNRAITLMILLSFFPSIILFIRLAKDIIQSLSKLHNGSDIIGQGNLDYKIPVTSKDELGQVAEAFNEMTMKLKTSYTSLEAQVLQRTKELNAKIEEMEKMNKLMVGRELKMIELKEQIKQLLKK